MAINDGNSRSLGSFQYAVVFTILACVAWKPALRPPGGLRQVVLTSVAVCSSVLAAAYWTGRGDWLLKSDCGRLAFPSYVLFWPYHALNAVLLRSVRTLSAEAPFHEVLPGLYLGSRLLPRDRAAVAKAGIRAVLDVSAEFGEISFLRQMPDYRCLPLLDTCAPTNEALSKCVDWVRERLAGGPVYIHCASGYGRSATVAAACLLADNPELSVPDAIARLKSKRAGVELKEAQIEAVIRYAAEIRKRAMSP